MALRQLGSARRRLVRNFLRSLDEHGALRIGPSAQSSIWSRPHSIDARLSPNPQQQNFVSSMSDFDFNRRGVEHGGSERGIASPVPLDVDHLPFGSRSVNFWHRRIYQGFLLSPDLKHLTLAHFDPLGIRQYSSQTRVLFDSAMSTASKSPAKPQQNEDNEAQVSQKVDASARDCDQAVVGLAQASEMAKKKKKSEKEAKKGGQTLVRKLWSRILGIGPALRVVASMSREDWAKKISGWKKHTLETLQHYWLGTKLLWADVRISSRLLLKLAGGKSLSRRERQQLTTTAADIFRLVPFAVFLIVPFMEFLLPVALTIFPNMLPSTFKDKMAEQEKLKKTLSARIQYAKFLQDTVGEMARELKTSRSGDLQKKAGDLDKFMNKVRTGADVTNEEIVGFGKLFNDELTLDNISRPRLISICKYMGIQPYGTDAYLRYSLRTKLNEIKADDRMIQAEGVNSLSESELRAACRERGMLGLLSIPEMRAQLEDWLDLSLKKSLPSSLLILSRAFMVSGRGSEEAIEAALSSLPDKVVDSISAVTPSEEVAERKRKLEYLKQQEELIKEEEARAKEHLERSRAEKELEIPENVILEGFEGRSLSISDEARQVAQNKAIDKQEELCNISRALAILASASSVSKERSDFLRLVNTEIRLYNNMVEKEGTPDEQIAREAYRHAIEDEDSEADTERRVSSALIAKVDAMLHKLEKELDDVDEKIGDRWRVLDSDHDGKVTPEEVAAAAIYLKDTLGQDNLQHLISTLAKDEDGKILVEDIVKLGSIVDDFDTEDTQGREQFKQPVAM